MLVSFLFVVSFNDIRDDFHEPVNFDTREISSSIS